MANRQQEIEEEDIENEALSYLDLNEDPSELNPDEQKLPILDSRLNSIRDHGLYDQSYLVDEAGGLKKVISRIKNRVLEQFAGVTNTHILSMQHLIYEHAQYQMDVIDAKVEELQYSGIKEDERHLLDILQMDAEIRIIGQAMGGMMLKHYERRGGADKKITYTREQE